MERNKISEARGEPRRRFSVPDNQLVALLQARGGDGNKGITVVDRLGSTRSLSYAGLYRSARQLCAGLQRKALPPGARVVLQLSDPLEVLIAFWGCQLAGIVAVPLNAAPYYHRPNPQSRKLLGVVQRFECAAILGSAALVQPLQDLCRTHVLAQVQVLDLDACLQADPAQAVLHAPQPADPAAMFLTSGSTGDAKGVTQSHAAMLAMADATIQMNGFTADDVTLNWMSMDHAGSLVFLGVMPLALGATQLHVAIEYVLKEPTRWLDLIDTWRASITWAPNFVFSLLLDRADQVRAGRWDLACMRFMVNAGEAVVSATARRFIALLDGFGLPRDALRPAFGMVETCSGITWSRGFTLDNSADTDAFVSLGPPIPGAAVKIVDSTGAVLPEGQEGRLLLQGPSVFKGYENEDVLNAGIMLDGWLVTGDLAFLREGELFVTGREKEMLIINGNNHYCHEIESSLSALEAIASDAVAAVGVRMPGEDTESLVVFYARASAHDAASATATPDRKALHKQLQQALVSSAGLAARSLVELGYDEFPRTDIGKIMRTQLKRRFEAGEFDQLVDKAHASATAAPPGIEALADDSRFTQLLEAIREIWSRVLGHKVMALDDTFFELGGSSLLAIQVQHALEQLLGREVSMVELFDTPTIRSMAERFAQDADKLVAPAAVASNSAVGNDAIAVIGIGCRFPGADGPDGFWQVLEQGAETIRFFSPEEAIAAGVAPARAHDPAQVNAAPVLTDIEGFDLEFWKLPRREAELLDPQQRVFLETAWDTFEDAGYVPGPSLGRVGVFASAATNTYLQNNVYANRAWVEALGGSLFTVNSYDGFNVMVANDKDYLPTRVSYKLDLVGPSMAVQTACSSTLVAIHEAVRALRQGDCDMALAGGCALMLPQQAGHLYEEGMINSPDGHCRAYDSEAAGTIFGSGSGAVLLKPLARAQADGDAIYAVIKGSAVVNDGGQKMGYTAPSMLGEYRAISAAIRDAGVAPDSIGFIEGHGTGTPIGDPIEVQALSRALHEGGHGTGYCALGSVKTNIGHMGIASGIAGFIKSVLALHHLAIPATLHFRRPNPAMKLEQTPFFINSETLPWPAGDLPRRAGVNSLGIGGTNAHVVLEEAPLSDSSPQVPLQNIQIVPLSAGSPAALAQRISMLQQHLSRHPELALADISHTLQQGRQPMAVRWAAVCADRKELQQQLAAAAPAASTAVEPGRVVFMFTGQGSQYAGMARELYQCFPVFRAALDECVALFAAQRATPLLDLLLAADDDAACQQQLTQTEYTQPALFCLQVALVQLYRSLGIVPDVLLGHSVGEIAGVWAAGGLRLQDAAALVERRSRLMQAVPAGGSMASVRAAAERVRQLLQDAAVDCEIAAFNSDEDTTICGTAEAIAQACAVLAAAGADARLLTVSHAFHSRAMECMQDAFGAAIADLEFRALQYPLFCNVDGQLLDPPRHDAAYWQRQLREPVHFKQGLQQAIDAGGHCFVEIGPASILCGLGRALDREDRHHWLPSLRKGRSGERVLAATLARLFSLGRDIKWAALPSAGGKRVHLPTYPWQRQRCWIDPDRLQPQPAGMDPLRAAPIVLPRQRQQLHVLPYTPAVLPVLQEHRVFGTLVPPAALYVSQLLYTAAQFCGRQRLALGNVAFIAPLLLPDAAATQVGREVHILHSRQGGQHRRDEQHGHNEASRVEESRVELSSLPPDSSAHDTDPALEQLHVTAELLAAPADSGPVATPSTVASLTLLQQRCNTALDPQQIKLHMQTMQVELGASFDCFRSIWRGHDEALALLELPKGPAATIGQGIPAGLIDCHWQLILAALPALPRSTVVPAHIERLLVTTAALPQTLWAHAQIQQARPGSIVATVQLMDAAGQILLETRGIELRAVASKAFRPRHPPLHLLQRQWVSRPVSALPAADAGTLWLTGATEGCARFAGRLQQAGIATAPWSPEQASSADLVYVADADTSAGDLNGFIASLATATELPRQLMVIVPLAEGAAADEGARQQLTVRERLPAVHYAALQVQACAAAHELPDLVIRTAAIDESDASLGALLALLGVASDTGVRYRIAAGEVSSLQASPLVPGTERISFDPEQLQVITGATGGLGLLTLEWMYQRGARRFLLVSRSEAGTEARERMAALQAGGAELVSCHCDLQQADAVAQVTQRATALGPVQVLVHAAGQRRDGLASRLHADDFQDLFRLKADVARQLQEALQPGLMLLYSSTAAWFGAAGQSNYAAANAALDELAARTPAAVVSVAWGPWRATGMTAQLDAAQLSRLEQLGYGFLEPETAFGLLERYLMQPACKAVCILAGDAQRLGALPGVTALWSQAARADAPGTSGTPLQGRSVDGPQQQASMPPLVATLLPLAERAAVDLLQDHLSQLVRELSGAAHGASPVDTEAGFFDLGIDSLAALELRKRLETALGLKLKSTLILDFPNITTMAAELMARLRALHPATGVEAQPAPAQAPGRLDLLRQLASEITNKEQA